MRLGVRVRLPEWDDYYRLLEIVKTRYDDIIVDLPEVVNAATRELVQRSRAVYLVSTPELLSLELAGRRMAELADWKVPRERVSLVLNRWSRGELKAEEAERESGCVVGVTLPNDYLTLRRALSKGEPAAAQSVLGRAFQRFAGQVAGPGGAAKSASSAAGGQSGLLRWLFTA